MNGVTKFIIGAVVTALMAMASHSAFGLGLRFIDKLQAEAQARVAASGLPGVTAAMVTKPMLDRVVVLSGPASEADRQRLLAEARAIPGVKGARWADGPSLPAPAAAPVAAPVTPVAPEAVVNCQAEVDSAVAGKVILFDTGTAALDPASTPLLETVAVSLKNCTGALIEIAGHTDLTGGVEANQRLSEARARTVVAALEARGVPAARLAPKGYGEMQPKAPGEGEVANAANRRIEFVVSRAMSAPVAATPQAQ
ncbi:MULTISPECIES: OmpA family protein [unclassified Brevundimonas]|uniref:OmpA family protein n=1 Tax=unclassified Brevundimonas TaxID=2622653 RepID=UPI0025C57019|nr:MULTISPECIES: OmpA family protein [unclassified Brevundimonas]